MTRRPFSVNITLLFILLNALIWLVLAILIVVQAHPGLPDLPYISAGMAALSFAFAICLLVLLFFVARRSRRAYYLAIAFLAGTALLAIFDDVGWSDLVVILLNLVPVILLVKDRRWFLQNEVQAL
jgi:lysylphosphatidylglycerol synthetase-like protein (DUF2156 family)